MPNQNYKKRKKKKKGSANSGAIALSAFIAVVAMIFLFLFVVNRWTVNINVNGDEKIMVEQGEEYVEQGARAEAHGSFLFKEPRNLEVKQTGKVDTSKVGGKYEIKYEAHYLWIKAEKTRTVIVADHVPPVIELTSDPEAYTKPGEEYVEEGFKATDNVDGDITDKVKKEVKEEVENKCKNPVDNSKVDYFEKLNKIYNSTVSASIQTEYETREDRLNKGNQY